MSSISVLLPRITLPLCRERAEGVSSQCFHGNAQVESCVCVTRRRVQRWNPATWCGGLLQLCQGHQLTGPSASREEKTRPGSITLCTKRRRVLSATNTNVLLMLMLSCNNYRRATVVTSLTLVWHFLLH